MLRSIQILVVVGVSLAAAPAFAWNSFGHMTVAAVAYKKLSPAVRGKVAKLLKLNPDYQSWVATTSGDEVAFVMAATWPDAIKSEAGYSDDGEHPSNPNAGQNIGYKDKLQHRYWHFIDTPFSPDGTALTEPVPPNIKTQIVAFRSVLASSTATADLKSYDLVWLLHLVGDIHQPLHCTSRFDHDQPGGDQGGNLVALCEPPCRSELHAFWDDLLGTKTDPTAAIKKASTLAAADPQLSAISNEVTWIDESFQAAEASVYIEPIGVGPGPFTLDAGYKRQAREVAANRIALAGARLANLLNDALK